MKKILFKKTIPFIPCWTWMRPFGYPIYNLPIRYYDNSGKFVLYHGLGVYYFKQMFSKKPMGRLRRFCWFRHLWLNIIGFIFLPYTMLNNYVNSGCTQIIKYK